jgi:hypothetical protein
VKFNFDGGKLWAVCGSVGAWELVARGVCFSKTKRHNHQLLLIYTFLCFLSRASNRLPSLSFLPSRISGNWYSDQFIVLLKWYVYHYNFDHQTHHAYFHSCITGNTGSMLREIISGTQGSSNRCFIQSQHETVGHLFRGFLCDGVEF